MVIVYHYYLLIQAFKTRVGYNIFGDFNCMAWAMTYIILLYSNNTVVPAACVTDKVVMLEVQSELQCVFVSLFPNHSEIE